MSKTDRLRALVSQRLAAAAEEIFLLFEQTFKDYEEEVCLSEQRIKQQHMLQCKDPACAPEQCEKKTDLGEDNLEPPHIKEEQEGEPWTAQGATQQEATDTKETMFNIIYVQKSDEDGRRSPCQSQEVNNKGDSLPCSLSDREGCGPLEPTSECQTSEDSGDEWRDGWEHLAGAQKTKQAGDTADRPYTCNVCNKTFRIKFILTRHMKTHTGEKPYSCSVCGKSFIQRSYLHTHMNSHSGQKPYTCAYCGRGFTQMGNMNTHMRIHTGEKPYSCADCGKSFRQKADLIKHTKIHTGEKPFSCTVCNMKFSGQSNLARHMKTHSGEKPYSCAACGKRFIRRSHLVTHMKTHTGES